MTPKQEIEQAAFDQIKLLKEASKEACGLLASAALDAKKTLAESAAEAVKVRDAKNTGDHDLLIELKTLMVVMQATVTEIKTGTSAQLENHEHRLQSLEKMKAAQGLTVSLGAGLIVIIFGMLIYHLFNIPI